MPKVTIEYPHVLALRITDELREMIEGDAREQRRTRSQVARIILEDYYAERCRDED